MPGEPIYVIVIVSGRFVDARIKRWLDPRIHAVASAANLISLFFAVMAGNLQRAASHFWRKSWAFRGLADRNNSGAPAVLSLFPAVLFAENSQVRKPALSPQIR